MQDLFYVLDEKCVELWSIACTRKPQTTSCEHYWKMTHFIVLAEKQDCAFCCPSDDIACMILEKLQNHSGFKGFQWFTLTCLSLWCRLWKHDEYAVKNAGLMYMLPWILISQSLLSVCLSRCPHPDWCRCSDDGGWFPWMLWCHSGVPVSIGNCESQSQIYRKKIM